MKKIVFSLSVIAVAAAVVVGATTAFFSDTETSSGNTFTAGSIDLKVDSECHYWIYDPSNPNAITEEEDVPPHDPGMIGYYDQGCDGWGNWEEEDLGAHKFFAIHDLKPGDWGEDTISLHVYDNDAWGLWSFIQQWNDENGCTEPELEDEEGCEDDDDEVLDDDDDDGELLGYMDFDMWLDQGFIPGFQNGGAAGIDLEEGDNIWQEGEPEIDLAVDIELWDVLSDAWNEDCDNAAFSPDGHNEYHECHGLAEDGRMVGSTTYYFGFQWHFPDWVGNDAQTDSLGGDMKFQVVQHRNNPDKDGFVFAEED